MSNVISKEVQLIAGAIKQAFERDAQPGNSVNATDNPHQVALIGRYSLYKAAEIVWEQLKSHLEAEQKRLEVALKAEIAKVTGQSGLVPVTATSAPSSVPAPAAAPEATK